MMTIWLEAIGSGLGIGCLLGLLGGGGALVSIPVLLYVFGFPFRVAVGSSLLLVTLGALPSLWLYWKKREVDLPSALKMGISGAAGAWLGSRLSPYVPQAVLLYLLVGLILLSAWRMFQPGGTQPATDFPLSKHQSPSGHQALLRMELPILLTGLGVGLLTGLVGVGGGFLIVPALIVVRRLGPRQAIATSLVVITFNALSGTFGYWRELPFHLPVFYGLMGATALGSLLGFRLALKLSQKSLKQAFGVLLLVIALILMLKPPFS